MQKFFLTTHNKCNKKYFYYFQTHYCYSQKFPNVVICFQSVRTIYFFCLVILSFYCFYHCCFCSRYHLHHVVNVDMDRLDLENTQSVGFYPKILLLPLKLYFWSFNHVFFLKYPYQHSQLNIYYCSPIEKQNVYILQCKL